MAAQTERWDAASTVFTVVQDGTDPALRERMLALACSTDRVGRSASTLIAMAKEFEAFVKGDDDAV